MTEATPTKPAHSHILEFKDDVRVFHPASGFWISVYTCRDCNYVLQRPFVKV